METMDASNDEGFSPNPLSVPKRSRLSLNSSMQARRLFSDSVLADVTNPRRNSEPPPIRRTNRLYQEKKHAIGGSVNDVNMNCDLDSLAKKTSVKFSNVTKIGGGQFSAVYRCISDFDGKTYAIKKLLKPITGKASERHVLREVRAHVALNYCPFIVTYHDAWIENDHLFIQNEYCNGGNLAAMIANGPLTLAQCRQLLKHLAEALKYLHSQNYVHMDIKPENVFVVRSEHQSLDDSLDNCHIDDACDLLFKVGDLGHVRPLENFTAVEDGDCRYLAVEVLREDTENLPKADVFSMALTVFEASGCGPYPKNGPVWHAIRQNALLPNAASSVLAKDALAPLLYSCIHADPALRPTAAQILEHGALAVEDRKCNNCLLKLREVNALKLKVDILNKQLEDAAKYIKSMKKVTRSGSTSNF